MRGGLLRGFWMAICLELGCGGASGGANSFEGGVEAGSVEGGSDARAGGGSEDAGSCEWVGTWSTQETPAYYTSGNCTAAPALPELVIGSDGSLAVSGDGGVTPCEGVMPSISTCQTFGLCSSWEITLNFMACNASSPCMGGLASEPQSSRQGDGGPCAVAFTLTHVGP
jgi:hypothetical protein